MVKLCLVRHGETAWNTERRIQGQTDIPLNTQGEAQALATAEALASAGFGALYSSDLSRARCTAQAIAQRLGLELRLETDLRERNYGLFQGRTYSEVESLFPDDYQRFISRDPSFSFSESGESLTVFSARVCAALERIADAHPDGQVLIITHRGVLDTAHRLATGKPLDTQRDFEIPNAALNWIARDSQGWSLLSWGDQSHLPASDDPVAG